MRLKTLVILGILVCIPYVWNFTKLIGCNFDAPYKCEVVHLIGVVIPPTAYVTVWFDSDE